MSAPGASGAGASGADVPPAVDPGAVDPGAVDPGAVDPAAVDPGAVDPGAVDPGAVDPGAVDPAAVAPGAGALDGELADAFWRYERALMSGDVAGQRDSFWSEPGVVRVDGDGPVIGPEALAEFRARRPSPGPRRLRGLHVVHSPGDTVVTVSVNERIGPDGEVTGLGTQTQVWARTADGWRVIAACVLPTAGS